jgi:hypothetical protein
VRRRRYQYQSVQTVAYIIRVNLIIVSVVFTAPSNLLLCTPSNLTNIRLLYTSYLFHLYTSQNASMPLHQQKKAKRIIFYRAKMAKSPLNRNYTAPPTPWSRRTYLSLIALRVASRGEGNHDAVCTVRCPSHTLSLLPFLGHILLGIIIYAPLLVVVSSDGVVDLEGRFEVLEVGWARCAVRFA